MDFHQLKLFDKYCSIYDHNLNLLFIINSIIRERDSKLFLNAWQDHENLDRLQIIISDPNTVSIEVLPIQCTSSNLTIM